MTTVQNFGANLAWQPNTIVVPASESELLAIMARHPTARFRAVGRLHSWSEAVISKDVLCDLRLLNQVTIHPHGKQPYVAVGAGCQIKRLLDVLNRRGYTLPTLGLIDEQTIAGATATATHGSGNNSLAHFIQSARVACFDPTTGQPMIREIASGAELRAIRCSLGCLGLVTELRLPIVPQYHVEEHFAGYATLDAVLAQETIYPRQQFYYLPWRWDFFAQHRREVSQPISRLAWLYRLYWAIGMDVGLHIIVRMLVRHMPRRSTPFFFRHLLTRLVPRPWRVVDRSDRQLTMQHELFRHIEIELFVKRSSLANALNHVRIILEAFAQHGVYQHHYPICIRKVLPDESLLAMSSDWDEPAYALSFISYDRPQDRTGFLAVARELAATLATRFGARPHWGKYNPLTPAELLTLYPSLPEFAAVAGQHDPTGQFTNDWLRAILAGSDRLK